MIFPLFTASPIASAAYAWLLTLNPLLLVILGVIVFVAGKLAKFIGIVMVIVGIVFLALPYILPHL